LIFFVGRLNRNDMKCGCCCCCCYVRVGCLKTVGHYFLGNFQFRFRFWYRYRYCLSALQR